MLYLWTHLGVDLTIFLKKIKLHLSNIFIEDIIPQINADLVALKVPLNLDLNAIISTSQFDKVFLQN